jgi:hypothetical protein
MLYSSVSELYLVKHFSLFRETWFLSHHNAQKGEANFSLLNFLLCCLCLTYWENILLDMMPKIPTFYTTISYWLKYMPSNAVWYKHQFFALPLATPRATEGGHCLPTVSILICLIIMVQLELLNQCEVDYFKIPKFTLPYRSLTTSYWLNFN